MQAAEHGPIVGVGELLWDHFPSGRRPGGAPANVVWQAMALGMESALVSALGRDPDGLALRAHLAERGLDDAWVQEDPDHPTGRVTVDAGDPERPQFTIHEDAAWDHVRETPALVSLAERAAAICFGTLAQRGASTRATLYALLTHGTGALCVYDVNLRQSWYRAPWIERSLDAADVVKLNDDEVLVLETLLDLPRNDPGAFGAALRERHGVGLTCITRGARGSVAIEGDEVVEAPATPVTVADAVGAGDAFTAGLTAARLWGWSLDATLRLANGLGALVASRAGATPDIAAEAGRLVRSCAKSAGRSS